eukprot:TRINITY_DN3438_c0_g6_i2.p1 TRINITY_DN3438_c0_g6~~TRINITY_DN3438_c0_g6_i2.p1  ORF type:complete len:510 (+),score=183.17 TRINITY_DN3438_c0_g6_i2:66-1595(+)
MTAGAAFREACSRHGVKKANAVLCRSLDKETMDSLQKVELGTQYVGNRGLMALMDVIEKAPNYRDVDFSNQKIYNSDLSADSVKGNTMLDRLIELARNHPAIRTVNLSGNPLSNFAARKLLSLATDNGRIVDINVSNSHIDAELIALIDKKTAANKESQGGSGGGGGGGGGGEGSPFGGFGGDDGGSFGGGGGGFAVAVMPPAGGGGLKAPERSTRRKTVMTKSYDQEEAKRFVAPKYPKSPSDASTIAALLRGNLLFSHLDKTNLQICISAMQRRIFRKGDTPLKEGDEGETLFVIACGTCDIVKKGVKVAEKEQGSAFGELELMYDTPCSATVQASSDEVIAWALDRETYKNLVVGASIRKRNQYESLLGTVPFLQELAAYEKAQLADALSSDEWEPGTTIITHGEEGQWMFLIVEGRVEVIGREGSKQVKVCEMGAGEYFGELEFFNNHPCVADIRAVTAVTTAKINRKHFEMCLGPVMHILKRNQVAPKYEYYRQILAEREKGSE